MGGLLGYRGDGGGVLLEDLFIDIFFPLVARSAGDFLCVTLLR